MVCFWERQNHFIKLNIYLIFNFDDQHLLININSLCTNILRMITCWEMHRVIDCFCDKESNPYISVVCRVFSISTTRVPGRCGIWEIQVQFSIIPPTKHQSTLWLHILIYKISVVCTSDSLERVLFTIHNTYYFIFTRRWKKRKLFFFFKQYPKTWFSKGDQSRNLILNID